MDFLEITRLMMGEKRLVQLDLDGKTIWRGLPRGYTQLEYIETTGEQYIDTDFVPNQDTRVVFEFMFRGTSSNGSRDIYGTRKSISDDMYWLRVVGGCWQPAYDTVLGGTGIVADTTNWHIADQNKNIFSIDGVVAYEFEYSEFETPLSLLIGGGQSPYNGYTYYPGKSRYRACRIYDDGVLVRNFIPCKDLSGNIGMYDTVTAEFRGNKGTGEFIAGPEWNGLPKGYKRLDYIETTGEQYINLGFVPNQDTRIVCEFMYFGGSGIYGARNTTSSNGFCMRVTSSKWQPQYNNSMARTSIAADTTNWHIADQNKNVFSLDGTAQLTFPYAEFAAPHPIILGGILANREGEQTLYPGECRYRATQVYDNGVLVRDLVPCKNADGEIGMYDTLNGKFYGNAGTGEFVAGPEL